MRVLIVAVGVRVPDWAQTAWDDYVKRFPPEIKVELRAVDTDKLMTAELTAERYAELGLKSGETVHVSPRRVRVFLPDLPEQPEYSI